MESQLELRSAGEQGMSVLLELSEEPEVARVWTCCGSSDNHMIVYGVCHRPSQVARETGQLVWVHHNMPCFRVTVEHQCLAYVER